MEQKVEQKPYHLNPILALKHSFHTFSLTLLTLLLPLSFLLLSKLVSSPSSSIPYIVLRLLVSYLSVSSLLHSLTGHLPKPHTSVSWAMVCTFQVCITLGIEATISAGIKPLAPADITRLMFVERAVFFVGMYETMLHWMTVFVKPVADDTVYGVEVREGRVDRVAIGVAFSALWLWMLRDEVGPMVAAVEKGGMVVGFTGWDGFVVWMVSYSTVVIGIVKLMEIVFWVASYLYWFLCIRQLVAPAAAVHHDSRVDEVVLLL